ncbi:MAG: siderophore-interacting protein [Actinobacteria bacterium]|nr:siderophore-interacting protein [Actinomycetota bacterium]
MTRRSAADHRRKPEHSRAIRLTVRSRAAVTPHMSRVTLGGNGLHAWEHMGFDQWFRLFLAPAGASLQHVPDSLTEASYARFMLAPASRRPLIRNYTVRAFRPSGPDGPELDVDLVAHGCADEGTAGPASIWARECAVGDEVAIINEGTMFAAPEGATVRLAADESGLPAAAGILRDLPRGTAGLAVIEVPTEEDRQPLDAPERVVVHWVVRQTPASRPGAAALARLRSLPPPTAPSYAWVAGESDLATGARRHWVSQGIDKGDISFCGYWKAGAAH